MPKVFTPFRTEALDVSDDEKAALERQGLVLDKAPAAPEQSGTKKVRPVLGGEIEVPEDEAKAMAAMGLLKGLKNSPPLDPEVTVPAPAESRETSK